MHLDACVVAGPGSGKTTVLVEYFRRLVAAGVDPLRILAITFTEKAAGNMRKKLAEAFRGDRETRAKMERAWVSTVHGFCTRLLRENAVFAGDRPGIQVAAERESWRMQQESIAAAMNALFENTPPLSARSFAASPRRSSKRPRFRPMTPCAGPAYPWSDSRRIRSRPARRRATCPSLWTNFRPIRRKGGASPSGSNLDAVLEGAERIVTAASPLDALRAVEGFTPNLRKCKCGTAAYDAGEAAARRNRRT